MAMSAVVTAAVPVAVAFSLVAAKASEQTLEKTHDSCSDRIASLADDTSASDWKP